MIITRGIYDRRTETTEIFGISINPNHVVISDAKREADEVQLALYNRVNRNATPAAEEWADKFAQFLLEERAKAAA